MILHYKDINIYDYNISFKKKIHLSKDFSFIPIQYNNIQLDIKVLNFDISQMTDHLPIYSKFSFNQ